MVYTLTFRDSFTTDFSRLPRKLQERMEDVNVELRDNPTRFGGNIKKLKGFEYLWRYRLDDYRLIYAVIGEFVEYLATGPRRDVYKRFDYDPDDPDELTAQMAEASLFPNSEVARKLQERNRWQKLAEARERRQLEVINPPLPEILTQEKLTNWNIPHTFQALLIQCQTKQDLESLFDREMVPPDIVLQVIDQLYPKHVHEIADQSVRILIEDKDFIRYVEGQLSQFLLKLDPEQEELVGWALDGPTLVKGGPGSGKSTVAMYRARTILERAQARGEASPSLLFTTYSGALLRATEQLLTHLLKDLPSKWEVVTVDSIAVRFGKTDGLQIAERSDLLNALRAERSNFKLKVGNSLENVLATKAIALLEDSYLLDEYEWVIEGRNIQSLTDYLKTDRSGRGQALPERLRRAVWSLYEGTKARLKANKLVTWGDIRCHAVEAMKQGTTRYDYVIVDEAQDLTPTALRLCVELVRDPRNIFLAADLSQSIYNRGFSFSKAHELLTVSKRTRRLDRNYRSTREIAEAALEILADTGAGDTETLAQTCIHFGPKPALVVAQSDDDHIQTIVNYIRQQSRRLNLPTGSAAILCPSNDLAKIVSEKCSQYGLQSRFMHGKDLRLETPEVKVMTIHAAKGLEFPIVVVPYLDKDVLPHNLSSNHPDDVARHEQHERRLFFVAATRAMRRLMVTTSSQQTSAFIESLTDRAWDIQY